MLYNCCTIFPGGRQEAAGIWENGVFEAAQIDRCLWNYQTSDLYAAQTAFGSRKLRIFFVRNKRMMELGGVFSARCI